MKLFAGRPGECSVVNDVEQVPELQYFGSLCEVSALCRLSLYNDETVQIEMCVRRCGNF